MALEPLSTGLALREDHALSIEEIARDGVPALLREYLEDAFVVELRILWKKGEETRRLWIFRDPNEITRLSAAFNSNPLTWPDTGAGAVANTGNDPAAGSGDGEAAVNYGGYIELYNDLGSIIGEHRFDADRTERITRFIFEGKTLVRAETRIRRPPPSSDASAPAASSEDGETREAAPPPAAVSAGEWPVERYCTDHYYYNRSLALRAVERVYHTEGAAEPLRLSFSHRMDRAVESITFENPQSALSAEYTGAGAAPGSSVLYTTDSHGRVLTETRKNEEGEVTGEQINTWAHGRLEVIEWTAGEDERRTEYEYNDAGDRIIERNYFRGMLERVVRQDGDKDIEELYMNNRVILRAIWENGRKISEERVLSDAQGSDAQEGSTP
jgi:hypothetical protein